MRACMHVCVNCVYVCGNCVYACCVNMCYCMDWMAVVLVRCTAINCRSYCHLTSRLHNTVVYPRARIGSAVRVGGKAALCAVANARCLHSMQKLLERPMAKFRVVLQALWTKDKDFEELDSLARDDDVMASQEL